MRPPRARTAVGIPPLYFAYYSVQPYGFIHVSFHHLMHILDRASLYVHATHTTHDKGRWLLMHYVVCVYTRVTCHWPR